MIEVGDIKTTKVTVKKIDFMKTDDEDKGRIELQLHLKVYWMGISLHKDCTAAKIQVIYEFSSKKINGKIEFILANQFNRKISEEEIKLLDSQKVCIQDTAPYFVHLLSEITYKSGTSPIVLDLSFVQRLIKDAKMT